MLKNLIIAILILFPSAAYADGFEFVSENRIEYKKTYNERIRTYINPALGLVLKASPSERKSELWVAPAFFFGFENGRVGPELKVPAANTRIWEMLLKLEMDIFKY